MINAYIKEIFSSVQGEALHIGEKQLFIRFCGCNLNCKYCDTDFAPCDYMIFHDFNQKITNPVSSHRLKEIAEISDTETISLTGGEPLLQIDFLEEFLPMLQNKKFYLETNGSMPDELLRIIKYIDTVSMDIKLECSTGQPAKFAENKNFLQISKDFNKEVFVKIILDRNYDKNEIIKTIKVVKPFDVPLILQPMDCRDKTNELDKNSMIELLNFTSKYYTNIRLIPQMHKFLNLL